MNYERLTHDKILEEHGKFYESLSPEDRKKYQEERKRELVDQATDAKLALLDTELRELTLGQLMSHLKEQINSGIVKLVWCAIGLWIAVSIVEWVVRKF
jgi:hypothetical protein